ILLVLLAPTSTRFPYTTLFRSSRPLPRAGHGGHRDGTEDVQLQRARAQVAPARRGGVRVRGGTVVRAGRRPAALHDLPARPRRRSEEHTSELQSRFELVCRLLL